ncbi:hypothetical protein GCM10011613_22160 [Cellvibrio zantedeschiae]|uniref:Lipoprotein n=1 Tax=Cellvibrio zantedeschiae TaxID=1237077 RepID=A0ABQ3B7E0_9GAMM|nr:hypothetical protein [Cellvibrio zantedeschiae]GGY77211.1 hypothetical protein GCM10011613_22160 [Cellvibrio zantedeschiae]
MQFPIIRTCQSFAVVVLLAACGGGGGSDGSSSGPFGSNISVNNTGNNVPDGTFRPAVANSPYSSQIVNCVKIVNDNPVNECKLSTLPFIGQKTSSPTKADILAQTVVSHPWMATRFEQLLDQMPKDIFLLFRGVTAVVIGADIRPSHYRSDSGAIYLDPADLWLNASERATISKVEDFRSGFSNGLAFRSLWRYVQGNKYAYEYYDLDGPISSRTIGDIVRPMAALLFHELAHANDFMPPAYVAQVNPQVTPLSAIEALGNARISTGLTAQSPLNSEMQFSLARVMYRGVTATDAQKRLSAEQVGLDFAIDGASDSYNYSSQYEDAAMLFEEVMMKYHYNVDRELAFTDAPPATGASCANYVVRWGVRNRIGEPLVKSRAQIVVNKLLGVNDTAVYFAALPAPRSMRLGVDWCNNLTAASREGSMQKMSFEPMPARDLLPVD